MAEIDGKNGAPASTGTPAGTNGGNGRNGKSRITSLLEDSKVVRDRAMEEIKALKQP